MPRKIPEAVVQQLKNEQWLREKHVDQCVSITELATELSVTPAIIRKALRSFGIRSPSQQQLRAASNMRKYGVTNTGALPAVRQKALVTMSEKFGGHNWSAGNRDGRDATCLKLYGDVNVGKTEYAKLKVTATNLKRYNRLHINQTSISDETYEKLSNKDWLIQQHLTSKKSILSIANDLGDVTEGTVRGAMLRVGIDPEVYTFKIPFDIHEKLTNAVWMVDQQHIQQKTCAQIASELGVDPWTVARRFHESNVQIKIHPTSQGEKAVGDFVESLGIPIERNLRNIISPKELDIYVPSHNLAIEFCGVYWHGERQGKYRTYHKEKHSACKEKGIQLITMYDWEWNTRQHQVQQKLRTLLGKNNTNTVYARKCSVQRISTEQKNNFFDDYHVQGTGPGSINCGLFFENELVAAISIIDSSKEYVINRYATKSRVVGGFTKLLKFFQRNHAPKRIVSFADLRWSNGDMYEKAGFKLEAEIPPDYAYIIGGEPKHKFAFRHAHLANKLPMYDPAKSEWENMYSHGFDRIWDCGKLRYAID
jgi:hypothetical protein